MKVRVIDNPQVRLRRWIAATILAAAALVIAPQAFADDAPEGTAGYTDTYVVSEGETLWSIASQMTPEDGDVVGTIDTIMSMNMLESSAIRAGEQIIVPVQG